jgi:hypothetical protein
MVNVPTPDRVTLLLSCNSEDRLMDPPLEIEAPNTARVPAVTSSEVEAPIVSVDIDVDALSVTGLFAVLEIVTTAELLFGATPPLQFAPAVQRSLRLPFQVCPFAIAGVKHSNASIPTATETQVAVRKLHRAVRINANVFARDGVG